MRQIATLAILAGCGLVGGCNAVLMAPSGDVALQQRNLLLASTGLMLLIILPVMALTLVFAWHYRASNEQANYDPDWHHSTGLEVAIWSVPLLIIVALGALTWMGTHLLDPYRPIGRLGAGRPVPQDAKPLTVQVVALDWKWLFFYPEQGIATVNELAAPVDRPLEFRITGTTVMNAFFVPTLAGMVYAMPGMETKLHAVINRPGIYDGLSAHYSGAGFSRMTFKFHGLSPADFDGWVAKVKGGGERLDRQVYGELEKPSEAEPVRHYGSADPDLFGAILNMCSRPGRMCMHEMMGIDAKGGAGRDSEANLDRLRHDGAHASEGHEPPGATFPASGRPPNTNVQPEGMRPDALSPRVNPSAPPAGPQAGPQAAPHAGPHAGHGAPPPSNAGPAPVQLNK